MIARTVVALAVAGLAGVSAMAVQAQEREPRGHESARGPSAAPMQGPGAARPGAPAMQGGGRVGGAQAPRAPGPGPGPAPGPGAGAVPGHGPQGPGFGQRSMGQAQAPAPVPAPRPPTGPSARPDYGHRPMDRGQPPGWRQPGGSPAAPQFEHRPHPEPRAPIAQAPRAYGAVPAPYRGDIHRFVDRDARVWRGGRWHHSHHGGRFGWWWVVGGLWYFYPQPVYPYPDPFAPGDVIYEQDSTDGYWYYCESAGQYYPYVTQCPEGWQAVIPEQ